MSKFVKFAIAVLFVLFFAVPFVGAQEGEDNQPTTIETGDDGQVNVETTEAPIVVETQSDISWVLVWVGAVSGLILGGIGVSIFARANQNKPLKDSTEALLANSVPAAALESANQISVSALAQIDTATAILREFLTFVRDTTDRKPNETPPAQG